MPNAHETLTSLFTDIANAIRVKTGSEAEIVADDFPTAISNITTGGTSITGFTEYTPTVKNVTGSDRGAYTNEYFMSKNQAKLYAIFCVAMINGTDAPTKISTGFILLDKQFAQIASVGDPGPLVVGSTTEQRVRIDTLLPNSVLPSGTQATVVFYGGYMT